MCRGQEGKHLIVAGGIGDQPAPLWDAFGTIARLWDEWDKECSD
jgi:hypothetical protein